MKIAVSGKGGCGKSTVTTLLAKELVHQGKEVLVIDSDESNYGLHCQLGIDSPKDFTGYFGGKEKVLNNMMLSKFSHQFFNETWTINDIPEGFYQEKEGIKLVTSGKIRQANEGCSCAMGTILQQFISNLQLTENQIALIDMEAGIEHFGRGIDNGVDLIVDIIDPSYESLRLSRKIRELADSIQKPIYYVLNKVTTENKTILINGIDDDSRIIAMIPLRSEIANDNLQGKVLDQHEAEIIKLSKFLIEGKSI